MSGYTERQIEAANLLQGNKVSSEIIDEIVNMIGEKEKINPSILKEDTEAIIKLKLLNETDWRKRATLSALIISNSLKEE